MIRKAFTSARGGAGRLIEVVGEAGIGKTRLLEALRDAVAGFQKLHATCEAYTSSIPYVAWRELLREMYEFGRDTPDAAVEERIRAEVATKAPDLAPWLPLLAAVFDVEIAATPEVLELAETNRRTKMHETVARFLEAVVPDKLLVEIDDVHHMDKASAELLALSDQTASRRGRGSSPSARRPLSTGFEAAESPEVVRIDLKPIAPQDALRLAQLATAQSPLPPHVLDVVAKRSGGNPQFLRDLLRSAIESGGTADLPESAEAATMTRIDTLAPDDRALVRRVAVFGMTFHPRMLPWLYSEEDGPAPDAAALSRLHELFDEEPDGYLRFRHTLLRDSAYEGLPFKLRRQLHGAVAAHIEEEMDFPEEAGSHAVAALFRSRRIPSGVAICERRPPSARQAIYAYVEAAGLYARALEAGRQTRRLGQRGARRGAAGDWATRGTRRASSARRPTPSPRRAGWSRAIRSRTPNCCSSSRTSRRSSASTNRRCAGASRLARRCRNSTEPEAARQMARAGAWYAHGACRWKAGRPRRSNGPSVPWPRRRPLTIRRRSRTRTS